ncbi:ArnT family glycosyltransferase [Nonomuraea roseoviolacea]|uniref:Glycosyltransferase RgtA/B/C/D-like domain-containing protein n=1 Tax=Nonomuraea roseoviolacea subsp. carminata TaxID=160689 RepID=A0ABT1JRK0_9ACTN|nr:hypothetical protein [Nonomuraea roseoviolacea]MCP2344369.1 hypothetical protein [Nonomuraea roseoviolacea subsp. carminata]
MLSTPVARTAHTTSPVRRPSPGTARRTARGRSRWLAWALAGGWLAQVLLRLWLYRYHTGPVANPDETGYLVAARWLAGGAGADLTGSTFYQGGYALLLVPAYWVTSDPVMVYRLVAGIGSVAAATAFPLAYVVLRRLALGRREAVALAFVAGLSPALLLFSGLALADAVLPTLVLGWLLATHDLARTGSPRAGVVAGALAGFATAVHLRGTVILAVYALTVVALLVIRRPAREAGATDAAARGAGAGGAAALGAGAGGAAARDLSSRGGPGGGRRWRAAWRAGRRLPLRAGVAALGAAGLVAAAGGALNRALASAVYPGGARDLSGMLAERLTGLDGQAWALSGAVGQLWYLMVGTWGLAGVGLVAAAVQLVRPGGPFARRVLAGTLLAVTLGVAYASSAALPDEHRVGNYVYGRYLACVAVVWTLVGLAVLSRTAHVAMTRRAATMTRRPIVEGRAGGMEGRAGGMEGRAATMEGRAGGMEGRAATMEAHAGSTEGRAGSTEGRVAIAVRESGARRPGVPRRLHPAVRRMVAYAGAAAVLMAATGGVAAWYAGDRLRRYAFIAFDFPEVSFLSGARDHLDMVRTTATALALLTCLTLAACLVTFRTGGRAARRPWARGLVPLVVALAAVNVAFTADLAPKAAPAAGPDWLPHPPPGRVALDTRVRWNVWVPLTSRVWWTRLERYDGAHQAPPAGACTAVVPPDAGSPPDGWTATGLGGERQGWTSWSGPGCR